MSEPAPIPRPLRDLWAETGVVLAVIVLPVLMQSIAYQLTEPAAMPFWFQGLYGIGRGAGAIALVWLLVRRSGEPLETFGMGRPQFRDIPWGVGVLIAGVVAMYGLWMVIYLLAGSRAGEWSQQNLNALSAPAGVGEFALLIAMSLVNGLAEEIVMRAYLIPRFRQLFDSTVLAVLLSTVMFAGYHSYQGSGGMISIAAIGLAYGISFCLLKRLWPVALAHALQDVLAFAMLAMR